MAFGYYINILYDFNVVYRPTIQCWNRLIPPMVLPFLKKLLVSRFSTTRKRWRRCNPFELSASQGCGTWSCQLPRSQSHAQWWRRGKEETCFFVRDVSGSFGDYQKEGPGRCWAVSGSVGANGLHRAKTNSKVDCFFLGVFSWTVLGNEGETDVRNRGEYKDIEVE